MPDELQQTLLAQCVLRAGRAHVERELADGRDPDRLPNRRETMRAVWRSIVDGSKVAALIVTWAMALDELGVDELRVEQFVAWSSESRATVHRRLHEFREAWPEHETPNELALLVLDEARARGTRPNVHALVPAA